MTVLTVEEIANLQPEEAIARQVELMGELTKVVSQMAALYEAHEPLNDLQPNSFENVIPKSLDEWAFELSLCTDDWKKLE